MPRSRQKNDEEQEYGGTYIFEIEEVIPSYLISTASRRSDERAYEEYFHLNLASTLVFPSKYEGRRGVVHLLGNRNLLETNRSLEDTSRRPCAGSVTIRGERTEYLGSLPQDMMWGLISSIQTKAINAVVMNGQMLRHGSAKIYSLHFEKNVNLDDY